jgi:HD domain
MSKMGSLAWTERTGGKMAWHERLSLLAQGVRARAAASKQRKRGIKIRNLEVSQILPPDSAITREAVAMAEDCSPASLFNHCLRAYFWARLLDADDRKFDDEALFVAIMLHDLGLTDQHRLQGDKEQCFTIVGARAAQALGSKHDWHDSRSTMAANAITMHLNVLIGDASGKEAQMVRAGSGGDIAGLGLNVLHQEQIKEVVDRYPRLNLKTEAVDALMIESTQRPCCRTAFLCNHLSFTKLITDVRVFGD